MKPAIITLTCRACNGLSESVIHKSDLYDIMGYEDNVMEWSDYEHEVPAVDEEHWLRSDLPPLQGQSRTVKVNHPFYMKIGESFWVLYTPVLSQLNGWDSYPNEIEQSLFVQCAAEYVIEQGKHSAWLRIKVLEVKMIKDFPNQFLLRRGDTDYLSSFEMFGNTFVFEYQDWFYLNAGAQGDLGVWGLIKRMDEQYHMLVYGDWNFHTNNAYAGNIALPKPQVDQLIQNAIEGDRYETIV